MNRKLVIRAALRRPTVRELGTGFLHHGIVCAVTLQFTARVFSSFRETVGLDRHRDITAVPLNCSP